LCSLKVFGKIGAFALGLNLAGVIEGLYVDAHNAAGTASGRGTTPACNNEANTITGWYTDASGLYHGFVRAGRRHDEDRREDREGGFASAVVHPAR